MTSCRRRIKYYFIVPIAVIAAICVYYLSYYNLLPARKYSADDFGIDAVHSSIDFNANGLDDYTDFLLGAKADAENRPKYDGRYFSGGYPPDNIGVCTDVIWRAFKNAGYSLRDMVDLDIQLRPEAYEDITDRDPNIDFRRVVNLRVFFDEYAVKLTNDPEEIDKWQPGDIVIFGEDSHHIGIVSDIRTSKGITYIIHNGGQPVREENYLKRGAEVTGHYRFDASLVEPAILIPWHE